ncbi:hypothetical protein [Hespellia stercorisuis]|uniref:Uncharacterized protein n=1 Tax=Hespellia stercorisuis DSM 15480 TaxID=1121950 RepID=A0A1M6TT21_9FIRM|nr:hypothetical protein [Hespellia stercorisuis]SHK60050.1 hypothetical protein SAMN02745243_03321 [Hespellia stercorisuis DSM 15480]
MMNQEEIKHLLDAVSPYEEDPSDTKYNWRRAQISFALSIGAITDQEEEKEREMCIKWYFNGDRKEVEHCQEESTGADAGATEQTL